MSRKFVDLTKANITTAAISATLPNGSIEIYTGAYTVAGTASGDLTVSAGVINYYELAPAGANVPGGGAAPPPTGGGTPPAGGGTTVIDPYYYAINANFVYSISNANVSAAQMNLVLSSKDLNVLLAAFLPGGDTYVGSAAADTFIGQGGNDTFQGGGGNNTYRPGGGSNTVLGSANTDTVILPGARSAYTITSNTDHSFTVAGGGTTIRMNSVENLQFSDRTVFLGGTDEANVARLYSAAFNRAPDMGGLNFWENIYVNNVSASARSDTTGVAGLAQTVPTGASTSVAASFIASAEFQGLYGSLSNQAYITQLYNNVLSRAPDAGGLAYWDSLLAGGGTRAQVLVNFAESPENIAKVAALGWLFIA